MTLHLKRLIDALERCGCRPRRTHGDQWRAHCPGPGHARGDVRPSLGVKGLHDRVLLNCFVCGQSGMREILNAVGLSPRDLFASEASQMSAPKTRRRRVAVYPYENIDGQLVSTKIRYEPKTFKWQSPDPNARGGRRWRKAPEVSLYRLPHLVDARTVIVVEGEKAVDRLVDFGFVATCPPCGVNVWHPEFTDALWRTGAALIVVIPDNDRVGREHALRVLRTCHGYRPSDLGLSCVPEEPWSSWPGAELGDPEIQPLRATLLRLSDTPDHGDVSDWFDAGHTASDLLNLIEVAPDADAVEHEREKRKRQLNRNRQRRHRAKTRKQSTSKSRCQGSVTL